MKMFFIDSRMLLVSLLLFLSSGSLVQAGTLGVLTYSISGDEVTITGCDTAASGTVEVPSMIEGKPVTAIGNDAFRSCSSLTGILLSEGITSIGDSAFQFCESLVDIMLPEGVTSMGDRAFESCGSLTSITLSTELTSIGWYAFWNCYSLSNITLPEGVSSIGGGAFGYCYSLSYITIPASVTSLGWKAFESCNGLISIDVEEGNLHYMSIEGILFNAAQTTLIRYPALKLGNTYVIPASVTRIGNGAFQGCSSLAEITLPSSLTFIEYSAFEGCSSLMGITIPATVTRISDYVFDGCSSLSYIEVEAGSLDYVSMDGVLFNAAQTKLMKYPPMKADSSYSIPVPVTEITRYAFQDCRNLASLSLPDGLTRIGSHAFENCSSLANLILPAGLSSIGYYVFVDCNSLTGLTIPASVTSIGTLALYDCDSLAFINIEAENLDYTSLDGVLFNADLSTLVVYPPMKSGVLYTLPSSVQTISSSAFRNCSSLTNLILPAGLTSIGSYAFRGCNSLTDLTIPASVTSIAWTPFFDCDELLFFNVEAGNTNYVSSAGVLFDIDQTELIAYPAAKTNTSYTLPASVETIAVNALRNSNGLLSIHADPSSTSFSSIDGVLFNTDQTTLITYPEGRAGAYSVPAGVTALSEHAFYGCSMLTEITLPSGLTDIGDWGFEWCVSLTEITLPDSVSRLGYGAFYRCSGLTNITFPTGIDEIERVTFEACSGLKTARFLGNAPSSFADDTFFGTDDDFVIHYSSTNSGFTSPMWQGYPATPWFVDNGLELNATLTDDPNGDGVDLLTAYALNLNPALDLSGSLPQAELEPDALGMTYYAASPGVTYWVETSEDLETWTTNDVSVSGLDLVNQRTASIDLTAPHRFLRLRVAK